MKKIIAVFGPSECVEGDAEYELAKGLGRALAERGYGIITGGFEGVMEAASRGAREAEGSVVSVLAEVYLARGREPHEFATKQIKVKSAVDSLMELIDIADAYVAVGISTGTLIEVMTAWDYMLKRFIPEKPILLLGAAWSSFYDFATRDSQLHRSIDRIEYLEGVDEVIESLREHFGPELRLPDLNIIDNRNG